MNLGYFSYLTAAIAFGLLSMLLLIAWRGGNRLGKLFTVAVVIHTFWAISAMQIAKNFTYQSDVYPLLEAARNIAWVVFLFNLYSVATEQAAGHGKYLKWILSGSIAIAVILLANEYFITILYADVSLPSTQSLVNIGHIILALVGLVVVGQLFQNTPYRNRSNVKFLFVSMVGIFFIDLYMYSDALLFGEVDVDVWGLRGVVNLAAVPLLAVSTARNKEWALSIFVSRNIVLDATVVAGVGVYLLFVTITGYHLRELGGEWARTGLVIFLLTAISLLLMVMLSGHLRSNVSVFIAKHFYKNKYDYRYEWLRLTNDLTMASEAEDRYKAAVKVSARIVEAQGGMIWIYNEKNYYVNQATYNFDCAKNIIGSDDSLISFLKKTRYIVNAKELKSHPEEYQGLSSPEWLTSIPHAWLVMPLFSADKLIGFIILTDPLVERSINWEDRDLLKSAANQISSYLVVSMMSEALASAKQFEVFNRLSAYMTHDLKNIAAELELVASNANKHSENPDFIRDAFDTVGNATVGINRLLDQIRNRTIRPEKKVLLNLCDVVKTAVALKQGHSPKPEFEPCVSDYYALAEKDRLTNVLTHLIDNAQQASNRSGRVTVSLLSQKDMHQLIVHDNGCGMDEDFIQYRLFKAFDTSKGNAGMGIGMYESQEFVTQLGGFIQVESTLGVGTSVILHIPAASPV